MAINFPDSPTNGDTFVANGVLYEYQSTSNRWIAVNYENAPQGFTGSQGDIGFTGSLGFAGSQGSIGFTGSRGNTGFTGSAGPVAGTDGQVVYNNGGDAAGTPQLYYDDVNDRLGISTSTPSEKLDVNGTIKSTSADITGNITVGGTVDGRDVAADGTKLDGIEAGATADQTAGEIKTAYESNADTNAFTDAEKSKLTGIEAGADVTDTVNVTAAGALINTNNLSDISDSAAGRDNLGLGANNAVTFSNLDVTGYFNTEIVSGVIPVINMDAPAIVWGDVTDPSTQTAYIVYDGTGGLFDISTYNLPIQIRGYGINIGSIDNNPISLNATSSSVDIVANGFSVLDNLSDTTAISVTNDFSIDNKTLISFVGDSFTYNSNVIWHAGNDGSGSGLDADLLDGIDSTQFLRSDTTDTMSGRLEMGNVLDMNNYDIFGVDAIYHHEDTNTYMQFHASDQWRVVTGGVERLEINSTAITMSEPLTVSGAVTATGWSGGELSQATWETGTSTTETIVSPAKIKAAIDANAGGVGSVVAWVNFNGIGTISIRESGNVSSVTDNGTGRYTVNFATALQDANYVVAGTHRRRTTSGAGSQPMGIMLQRETVPSTTSVPVESVMNNSPSDSAFMHIVVIR